MSVPGAAVRKHRSSELAQFSTPKKDSDPGQSSLFSLLGHLGSAQVVTINHVMLLDTPLLLEGMHNPGQPMRDV